MKLIHLGDLHIGKRIYEFSMLENQQYVLEQILRVVREEKPEAVLLSGDIYDKSVPSAEAVQLFDWFLTDLAGMDTSIFVIAGNHDSPERLQFGSELLRKKNVYITGTFQGKLQREVLTDEWGDLTIFSLPYVKPATVRPYFSEQEINSYEQAVAQIISREKLDTTKRAVLLCHQFVTAQGGQAQQCESEMIAVGGLECMDVSLFDGFDYVALGHLHSPQRIGRDTVRYGGSILKYSFSEVFHTKSLTVVELKEKGNVTMRQIPLLPKYDMRRLRGPLEQLTESEVVSQGNPLDFLQVILTDQEPVGDPLGRIRTVYPNVMSLGFEPRGSRENQGEDGFVLGENDSKSVMELFENFFVSQNDMEMNEEQCAIMEAMMMDEEGEKR